MSDLTDVQNMICATIFGLVYPDGTGDPSALGVPIKIYPGWPDPRTLDTDLAPQGSPPEPTALHVTVFSTPSERNTTRYRPQRVQTVRNPTTYTLSASGQTITVGGAAPDPFAPQNLAVFVNGLPYVVGATSGQTPSQVAAALQALIVVGVPGTTVAGPVITLPAGTRLGALRVGYTATVARPVRQTEKLFQISVWADTPANRSALAELIDPVLADTPFLALPDGFAARLRYRSTTDIDADQKQSLYRRDLFYTVEYSTTISETAAEIVVEQINLDDQFGDPIETFYAGDVVETAVGGAELDFSDPNNSGLIPAL